MNEIRMYVEHLFEGKTLTKENIELKEEIYGNLVARFEDYVAAGMSADEALERTKASMTSVEDVLAGAEAEAEAQAQAQGANGSMAEKAAGADAHAEAHAETSEVAAEKTVAGAPVPPSAVGKPVPPAGVASSTSAGSTRKKRKWIIAAVIALVVIGATAIGWKVFDELADAHEDYIEDQYERQQNPPISAEVTGSDEANANTNNGGASNASGADSNGSASADQQRVGVLTFGDNGAVYWEGERGDQLMEEVAYADINRIREQVPAALSSDDAGVEALIKALPLGAYAHAVDATQAGAGVLSFEFREVPDAYDGDSVELALAYDATVLFCALPDISELRITLTESDEPYDEDYFVFTRAAAERAYGQALTSDTLSEENWAAIKEQHLYTKDFAENLVDAAEHDWR